MAVIKETQKLSKKMSVTLNTLTHDKKFNRELSDNCGLRMFVAKDGLYVGQNPAVGDYYKAKIHTEKKDKIDFVTLSTEDFQLTVDIQNQGLKTTYKTIRYCRKASKTRVTIENKEPTKESIGEKIASGIKTLTLKFKK